MVVHPNYTESSTPPFRKVAVIPPAVLLAAGPVSKGWGSCAMQIAPLSWKGGVVAELRAQHRQGLDEDTTLNSRRTS